MRLAATWLIARAVEPTIRSPNGRGAAVSSLSIMRATSDGSYSTESIATSAEGPAS